MSGLKKINFMKRANMKKQEAERAHVRMTGVEITENPVLEDSNKIAFLFSNALLNFLVVAGTTGCFLKPFSIKANMAAVLTAIAVLAVFMAFLYYNSLVKTIGYLLAFSGFVYGIYNYRYLIKGGFGYICNHMMEFLEDEFQLPIERSYDVYGYGESLSVTVCLIFIAFAVMLLFNMAISESKGFVVVFLFTFPVVQLGMYFDLKLSLVYFAMYVSGILSLSFLRNSRHYHIETKKKKGYQRAKKKNKVIYNYVNDGKFTFCFTIGILIIAFAVLSVTSIVYPQKKYTLDNQYSEWKEDTRDFAKRLATVGFWGMLSSQGSAGGVGRSRLGQSKYVQLDYETDLSVTTMVEKGEQSIYLKAFNGTFYKDEYWETIDEHKENTISLEDYGLEAEDLENLSSAMFDNYSWYKDEGYPKYSCIEKKIQVANKGASASMYYIPYYITSDMSELTKKVNDDEQVGGLKQDYVLTIWYTPMKQLTSVDDFRDNIAEMNQLQFEKVEEMNQREYGERTDRKELWERRQQELETEQKYAEYVHDMYMEVPEENLEVVKEFCETYNLSSDSEDIVEQVATIFEQDYEYTLMPGRTPKNKEFVNYFLSESKKGYCTYFATSATLIFRYLGIPARYAGGYVLQEADFASGNPIALEDLSEEEELYSEWSVGNVYSERYPYGLCEYELDDSMAHAWVEIYIDGFGWIPVETTPSADEAEEPEQETQSGNLMNFLTNTLLTQQNIENVRKASVGIFFMIVAGSIGALCIYVVLGIVVRCRRKKMRSVDKLYGYLQKCLVYTGVERSESITYEEYGQALLKKGLLEEEAAKKVVRMIEKEKFSKNKNSKEDLEYLTEQILLVSEQIYTRLPWYRKLVYRYIKML